MQVRPRADRSQPRDAALEQGMHPLPRPPPPCPLAHLQSAAQTVSLKSCAHSWSARALRPAPPWRNHGRRRAPGSVEPRRLRGRVFVRLCPRLTQRALRDKAAAWPLVCLGSGSSPGTLRSRREPGRDAGDAVTPEAGSQHQDWGWGSPQPLCRVPATAALSHLAGLQVHSCLRACAPSTDPAWGLLPQSFQGSASSHHPEVNIDLTD